MPTVFILLCIVKSNYESLSSSYFFLNCHVFNVVDCSEFLINKIVHNNCGVEILIIYHTHLGQ